MQMITPRILSLVCLLGGFTSSLFGAESEWPQWRGPKRDGHSPSTGLLPKWPAGGPSLMWKATGLGTGYSSVSLGNGTIFTMGDSLSDSFVHAIDLAGKPLWKAKVGKPGGNYPGPRCTPTSEGGHVFALGQFGDLLCVEEASGKEIWRKNLEKDFNGRMMSGWGYSESPLVDGDKVVCTPGGADGTIVALNKKDGSVVWRSKDFKDSAAYSSLVVAEIGGVRQYIQLTDSHVAGFAAADGQVLWQAKRPGRTAVIPTPVVQGDLVYVTSGYGVGCNLFRVSSSGSGFKAEEVYANKGMVNHHGGVVLVNDHIYGYSDGKGWVCQEFKTGKTVWEEKQKLGKGAISYADGHLYLRSEGDKGTVALIEATPRGYKESGRFDQPDRSEQNSWPHPVIAGGRLYLRDQDFLLCYDVKSK